MEITINGEKKEAIFSIETLTVYEEEFASDLLQDVLGKATFDPQEAAEEAEEAQRGVITIDYTQTNWLACYKALWAGLRVSDPSTPSYKHWSKGLSISATEVSNSVIPEVIDKFFRPQEAEEEI